MHGLPRDISALNVLSGSVITEVRIGLHEAQVVTDNAIGIRSAARIGLRVGDAAQEITHFPTDGAALLVCLGRKVEMVVRQSDKELRVVLDGGLALSLHDEFEDFESFMVEGCGMRLVV